MKPQFNQFVPYVANAQLLTIKEAMLEQREFHTPLQNILSSTGFVRNFDGEFITKLDNGDKLLTYRKQEKKLHKYTFELKFKAAQIMREEELGRKLKKDEKLPLKEAVEASMIPNMPLEQPKDTLILLTEHNGKDYVIVSANSVKAAEEATSMLRSVMGSLPITLIDTVTLPDSFMTRWVESKHDKQTHKYTLGNSVGMVDEEGMAIKITKGSVSEASTEEHINNNAKVVELELEYDGFINFKFTEDLIFKGIKYSDIKEFNDYKDSDAYLTQEATDIIITSYVKELLFDMITTLGGLNGEEEEI